MPPEHGGREASFVLIVRNEEPLAHALGPAEGVLVHHAPRPQPSEHGLLRLAHVGCGEASALRRS